MDTALKRALEELETAKRLLDEIFAIGLWSSSDDCSFNRRRRQGLRETDWAVSGALRAVAAAGDARFDAFAGELRALVAKLEPLPDTVPDTMADRDLAFDATIWELKDEVDRLREVASQLLRGGLPDST